jgi:hypothetical protein
MFRKPLTLDSGFYPGIRSCVLTVSDSKTVYLKEELLDKLSQMEILEVEQVIITGNWQPCQNKLFKLIPDIKFQYPVIIEVQTQEQYDTLLKSGIDVDGYYLEATNYRQKSFLISILATKEKSLFRVRKAFTQNVTDAIMFFQNFQTEFTFY